MKSYVIVVHKVVAPSQLFLQKKQLTLNNLVSLLVSKH